MSPASPPVQHTSTLRTPSAAYSRGRARALRRFVVGVRVHLEQAEPLHPGLLGGGHEVGGYRTSSRRRVGRSPAEFTHVGTPLRPKDAGTPSVACPSSWGPWRRIPPVSFAPARPQGGACCGRPRSRVGGVVLAVFFLAVLERFVYAGDVMPGVKVEGVDVEGKNEDAAFADISAMATKLETEPLRATIGDREVVADASILEVHVDELATLSAARHAGRSGNPIEQTVGTVLRRFRPDEIPMQVSYSTAGLEGVLDGLGTRGRERRRRRRPAVRRRQRHRGGAGRRLRPDARRGAHAPRSGAAGSGARVGRAAGRRDQAQGLEGGGRTRGRRRSRHAHRQSRHRRERCDRSDHTRTARDRARHQDRRPAARARHRQRQAARRARYVVGHGRAGARSTRRSRSRARTRSTWCLP